MRFGGKVLLRKLEEGGEMALKIMVGRSVDHIDQM
jgi:hypothetical protein